MNHRLFRAAFLCLMLPTACQRQEKDPAPLSQSEQDHFKELHSESIRKINDYYAKHGFPVLPESVRPLAIGPEELSKYQVDGVRVGNFEFRRDNGQLVSFSTSAVNGTQASSANPIRAYTTDEATNLARDFARTVLGPVPGFFTREPEITHIPAKPAVGREIGYWIVRWRRTDSEGHPFQRDVINVLFQDGQRPTNLALLSFSSYNDRHINPIPEDRALTLAARAVGRLRYLALGYYSEIANLQIDSPKTELAIVNPNLLPFSGGLAHSNSFEPRARLAWTFLYHHGRSPDPIIRYPFQVWIDAETGDLLGWE